VIEDPMTTAQARAARRTSFTPVAGKAEFGASAVIADPIHAAQVMSAAEKVFPNLAAEQEKADLLRRAVKDPSMRGNLRGRIAEEDWINRNSNAGWKPVKSRNAPQNDAYRFVNGKLEGAQVKVHAEWHDYIPSMTTDHRAERFALPDDHFDLVYRELETRRVGALRGGLIEKANEYNRQQLRLMKMGRTFAEVDGAVGSAATHYERISAALRAGGKAASFVAIAVGILDGGIAVYEVATGKLEVQDLVKKLSKVAVGGAASWTAGNLASTAAISAGASGAVPVAVAIVVATGTYLVVDWALDSIADSLRVSHLSTEDINRLWPAGARGVPLDRLYRKPPDPAAVLK
jgi:hypothetical protein